MNEQAFELLRDQLTDIKKDLDLLRGELRGYQRTNNDVVTRLRINVGKLVVITGLMGMIGGGIGHTAIEKFTPILKNEKIKIEKTKEGKKNEN